MNSESSGLFESLNPGLPFLTALVGVLALALVLRLVLRRAAGAERFDAVSDRIEQGILLIFFLGILVFSIIQIILRNLFDSGWIWVDPLLRHLTLWIAFLGAFTATARGRHIAIDVVSVFLSGSRRRGLARAVSLVAAFICAALANGAYEYLQMHARFPREAFLDLTTGQVQSILLFGFVLLAYRFLVTLFWGRDGELLGEEGQNGGAQVEELPGGADESGRALDEKSPGGEVEDGGAQADEGQSGSAPDRVEEEPGAGPVGVGNRAEGRT